MTTFANLRPWADPAAEFTYMHKPCAWIGKGEGCTETTHRKSYCKKHYRRVYQTLESKRRETEQAKAEGRSTGEFVFKQQNPRNF